MKKFLLLLVLIVSALGAAAQDVIVKKDGSTVLCRVLEVNGSDIVYKRWSDLNGPNYVMDRTNVTAINYQDGRQDKMNEQTVNAYAPGIQQTGTQQYNDNALLMMDRAMKGGKYEPAKAKKLRLIGWTVGGVLVVGGGILMGVGYSWGIVAGDDGIPLFWGGAILAAGGIATTTICLVKANKIVKEANYISSAPILQQEFNLGGGKSLMAGVDMMRDNRLHQTSLGLGFRLNF